MALPLQRLPERPLRTLPGGILQEFLPLLPFLHTESSVYTVQSCRCRNSVQAPLKLRNVPLFLSSGSKVRVMVMIVRRSCGQGVPSISYRYGIT